MPPSVLLLTVDAAWALPGLGLLVLPHGPTPHLLGRPLHSALHVELLLPDGQRWPATATVEEVHRAATPERAMLLDPGTEAAALRPGTEIWLPAQNPE